MRKIFFLALLACLTAGVLFFKTLIYKSLFHVSGEVSISHDLKNSSFQPNSMLFIIARNKKGVPFAVQEIINPVFPARFTLNSKNLLFPDLITSGINLETTLTLHGNIGKKQKGDFFSSKPEKTFLLSKNAVLLIDSEFH